MLRDKSCMSLINVNILKMKNKIFPKGVSGSKYKVKVIFTVNVF